MVKLPRMGTFSRIFVDAWIHDHNGGISFSSALDLYVETVGLGYTPKGQKDFRAQARKTVSRILRKYGHKGGPAGSKKPWFFGPFCESFPFCFACDRIIGRQLTDAIVIDGIGLVVEAQEASTRSMFVPEPIVPSPWCPEED